MNTQIWPEFEIIPDFMLGLVTCKFEDDSIKSEGAINIFSIVHLWENVSLLKDE